MYQAKNFDHLIGLTGFSDAMLANHFTLYQGYVTNTNKLIDELGSISPETPQYAEIKRRFGWEWNGMRLHEYYFGNMSKAPMPFQGESPVGQKITDEFGSYEAWEKDFRASGALRGIGWVILAEDLATGKLFNVWVNEHDTGHLSGTRTLLVMDVFEHAFMLDYGLKRADYIEAFFKTIDWETISARFA